MKVGAHIMASCVLLGGADFLAAHGAALSGTLAHSLESVGEKGLLALLPVRAAGLLRIILHQCCANAGAGAVGLPVLQCNAVLFQTAWCLGLHETRLH